MWLMSTVAIVVLLFSYRTSTMGAGPVTTTTGDQPGGSSVAAAGGGGAAGGSGSGAGGNGTYNGSVAQTRWGPVQVVITVSGGKITAVNVPTYPTANRRDQQINAYALPILQRETMAAQSADIDTVSGATVTSQGYIQSLQAALDAAHL
jgi:major membrane immunogen (membrane-anchored lipoprotein)